MQMRSYLRHRRFRHNTAGTNYTPKQLAFFYEFPKGFDGSGKKVAVIELGGGYVQADLDSYFKSIGLAVKPVVFHSINGAKNSPGDPNGADGEVMLDLCVIGGMAPGVALHCYMAGNTDGDFLAAIEQAIKDKMDAISISWGGSEDQWDPTSIQQFNAAFERASTAGITVTAAAGDNGSGDGEPGQHVDFPASSPYVLGCGGTSLKSTSPIDEEVWNDGSKGGATGGGVSSLFAIPAWQQKSNVPGAKFRGVPDVAGNDDPETGWIVIVDGQTMVIGGTSAVAPMWAALSAVLSQALGKNVGFLNPSLYALAGWDRDITVGNNGTYLARPGYDCCTGLGVPNAAQLLSVLGGIATAPAPSPAPTPTPPSPSAGTRTIVVTGAQKVTVDGKIV
jgi:kumamolisin